MADRAVLWLEEVIASHGTTDGPGRVRIPLSQAALARATARSAGTVTYYVRCLGPLIERRDGVLIVDIAALAERRDNRRGRRAEVADQLTRRFDQATADGSTIELVDGDGPPTVREMAQEVGLAPSLVQRHLHALETDGRAARHGRYLTLASEATERSVLARRLRRRRRAQCRGCLARRHGLPAHRPRPTAPDPCPIGGRAHEHLRGRQHAGQRHFVPVHANRDLIGELVGQVLQRRVDPLHHVRRPSSRAKSRFARRRVSIPPPWRR